MESFNPGEVLPPHLKIGAYPIPKALVERLFAHVDRVLIIEEGYPFIESSIRGILDHPLGKKIYGRLDGRIPRTGELNPDLIRSALGRSPLERQSLADLSLPNRNPSLCDGCSHADVFHVLRQVLEEMPSTRIFSDIGCYTLGAYPPYNVCHSCVDMGASISMAMGASQAGIRPVLATIGDSTFVHSGMTPLVGAAKQNLNMTVLILDNSTVAMTGGQQTMASGDPLVSLVQGLGVAPEHVHPIRAHRREQEALRTLLRQEMAYEGLSVIIPRRECIQTAKK
jgi:indolepyruvate ferredoxin oxidoreductase alpha subunit